ncbi:hypothetical protein ABZ543_08150 [Streptomyces roseifaciens]
MSSERPADDGPQLVPVKWIGVQAVMPDGAIKGKSTTVPHGTPDEVLGAMVETLRSLTEQEFPGAVEYRPTDWMDSYVPLVDGPPAGEP